MLDVVRKGGLAVVAGAGHSRAADTHGVVLGAADSQLGVLPGVDLGDLHAVGTHVQGAEDLGLTVEGDPGDGGGAARLSGAHQMHGGLGGQIAVLAVQNDKVEAGQAADFHHVGGVQAHEGAETGLTGVEVVFEFVGKHDLFLPAFCRGAVGRPHRGQNNQSQRLPSLHFILRNQVPQYERKKSRS